jgi:hypothetical protein
MTATNTTLRRLRPVPDQVCGHVLVGPTGVRWVCIAQRHGPDDPPPPNVDPAWWSREAHHYVRHPPEKGTP